MRLVDDNTEVKGFYVYRHTFSDGRVYVGKGHNHRYCDFRQRSDFWKNVYSKYGAPIIHIIEDGLDEETALELEMFCIEMYLDIGMVFGGRLINLTLGGEGTTGYRHDEATKELIGEVSRRNWTSPEYRARYQDTIKKVYSTEKAKEVKSEATKNNWKNPEYRKNKIESIRAMWKDEKHIEAMSSRMKGKGNPSARRANIYTYPEGTLVAENVVSAEWARDNGYNRSKLQVTSKADRRKPSTANNPHHHKGVYMEYIDGK